MEFSSAMRWWWGAGSRQDVAAVKSDLNPVPSLQPKCWKSTGHEMFTL